MGFTGPSDSLQLFGITLIGGTPENGAKLLLTLIAIFVVVLVSRFLQAVVGKAASGVSWPRVRFWARQAVKILIGVVTIVAIVSIWSMMRPGSVPGAGRS